MQREEVHYERLKEATDHIEQEARMILPGIQALFGFQLIAVFNARFELLTPLEQNIHWLAVGMSAIATLFTIAPAAYHRQAEPNRITRDFISLSSLWLTRGMNALALGIALDFYLIGRVISGHRIVSGVIALLLFGLFKTYWTIFPRVKRKQSELKLAA